MVQIQSDVCIHQVMVRNGFIRQHVLVVSRQAVGDFIKLSLHMGDGILETGKELHPVNLPIGHPFFEVEEFQGSVIRNDIDLLTQKLVLLFQQGFHDCQCFLFICMVCTLGIGELFGQEAHWSTCLPFWTLAIYCPHTI